VDNIGKKDFVRVTDKKLTGATYVHVNFSAPPMVRPAQGTPSLNNSVIALRPKRLDARPIAPPWLPHKVFLIGNLTRDPELRVTRRARPFASSASRSTAVQGRVRRTRDETTFVDIEAWANRRAGIEVPHQGQPRDGRGPVEARPVGRQDERPEAQQDKVCSITCNFSPPAAAPAAAAAWWRRGPGEGAIPFGPSVTRPAAQAVVQAGPQENLDETCRFETARAST